MAGRTLWVRGGIHRIGNRTTNFKSQLSGTAQAPVTVRAYPGERATVDGSIQQLSGGNVIYWGLEIMNSQTLDPAPPATGCPDTHYFARKDVQYPSRTTDATDETLGKPWPTRWWFNHQYLNSSNQCTTVTEGDLALSGMDIRVPGVKLINMVVHDSIGGGIGWTTLALGGEIYGTLAYHNGWEGTDRGHGHGLYAQNATTPYKKITNSMFFENFAMGAQTYGSDGYVAGSTVGTANYFDVEGTLFFNAGVLSSTATGNYLLGTIQGTSLNPIISGNFTYHSVPTGTSDFDIGYDAGTTNGVVNNNYIGQSAFFNGNIGLQASGNFFASSTVQPLFFVNSSLNLTNNTFVGQPYFASSNSFANLSGNTFYQGSSGSVTNAPGNTYLTTAPALQNNVAVEPNTYELGRANIIVYNWQQLNTVTADVSRVGLNIGDQYELHNAQDFYGDVITGTYQGGSIPVPMTGHSLTPAIGGSQISQPSTFPQFGAFVMIKK